MGETSTALDCVTWLLDWPATPRWIREILRLFKRQIERRM